MKRKDLKEGNLFEYTSPKLIGLGNSGGPYVVFDSWTSFKARKPCGYRNSISDVISVSLLEADVKIVNEWVLEGPNPYAKPTKAVKPPTSIEAWMKANPSPFGIRDSEDKSAVKRAIKRMSFLGELVVRLTKAWDNTHIELGRERAELHRIKQGISLQSAMSNELRTAREDIEKRKLNEAELVRRLEAANTETSNLRNRLKEMAEMLQLRGASPAHLSSLLDQRSANEKIIADQRAEINRLNLRLSGKPDITDEDNGQYILWAPDAKEPPTKIMSGKQARAVARKMAGENSSKFYTCKLVEEYNVTVDVKKV